MKKLQITWKGITPLIMHSCQCVNPLHPLTKEMKKYTSKKPKTDEDYEIISNLEWDAGVYWKDELGLYIPAENIEATIINGAKANKKGKDIQKFVTVESLYNPVDIGEKITYDEMKYDLRYRDVRQMVVNRVRITRTRPRFNNWKVTFELIYDENQIDIETIQNALEYAGNYVGLCDSRPKYGKFVSLVKEIKM